jgi:D-glycero-D-manno-heptose 1,7-bisphosphate phosphatase
VALIAPAYDAAVFLDKDGTLIEDVPFNVDPERVHLAPCAGPALRTLAERGYRLVLVSNQPGVAYGLFDERDLSRVEERLRLALSPFGVTLEACLWCPHAPVDGCGCRKPAPGLLIRASRELGIDLERSWLVGDILDDVEAGRAASCRTVLLDVGSETEWNVAPGRIPDRVVPDLPSAARSIVARTPVQRFLMGRGAT